MAEPPSPDESQMLAKKRDRKLSWVGVDENTPYSYLREAMVSSLMGGICDPQSISQDLNPRNLTLSPERKQAVAEAVGSWSFSAHDFTDDELLYGDLTMLEHALKMEELEEWRMSPDELTSFLLASRAAYNDFVLYHNFRHISDVLQAVFFFLVSIGILPPYPAGSKSPDREPSAIASLLQPHDALTLLIAAIGHDVGHPGVNNAFLVALNAPLAQLYNDRSVLESFHCAAYSQILRRHWPQAFADTKMRRLMIETILATDMGVHFKYMSDVGNLQEKLAHNNRTSDGWSGKVLEEYRDLACGLLIKCADISNVARKFHVAAQWANILTDEFSNQGSMEQRLGIPTCLFGGPPVRDDHIKLGQSQIGFMNVFARPLFEAVTDILPAMQFAIDELSTNKARWDREIVQEKERQYKLAASNPKAPGLLHLKGLRGVDDGVGTPSPKSRSTEFFPPSGPLGPLPTSAAENGRKGESDPNPMASIEVEADTKRRLFNPGNAELGSAADAVPNNKEAGTSMPSSRRGSADPSLTAILVTQQGSGTPGKDGKLHKKDKRDGTTRRSGADIATTGPEHARQMEKRTMSPTGSQGASDKGIVLAPDENAGSVTKVESAYDSADAGNFGSTNGAAVNPGGGGGGGGKGIKAERRTLSRKSQSLPSTAAGGANQLQTIHTVQPSLPDDKAKPNKFGLSKFWKKKWRAVSGTGLERDGDSQREDRPVHTPSPRGGGQASPREPGQRSRQDAGGS